MCFNQRLSDNYLDTTGILKIYEDELEDNADLLSILNDDKDTKFGWSSGEATQSTYNHQISSNNFNRCRVGIAVFVNMRTDIMIEHCTPQLALLMASALLTLGIK